MELFGYYDILDKKVTIMHMNYKMIFIIVFLLFGLSVSTSILNYKVSLEFAHTQLQKESLPLTIDNIYTEIQKHIIEPNLVASMMSQDTFLKEWLINREQSTKDIQQYLESIKNKYSMFTTFLVSQKTQNYYTSKGFIEKINADNKTNNWYYTFKNSHLTHEVNLDYNKHIDNNLIMFINHKIFDKNYHMIGVTGVGFKISYIEEMLKQFRRTYSFRVYFIDKNGEFVLYEKDYHNIKNIHENKELKENKDKIINKNGGVIKIYRDDQEYLLNVKHIKELNLYLIVEANVATFTAKVKQTFYINLFVSLLITIMVALFILYTMKHYNKRLEHMAMHDALTELPNRRSFNKAFNNIVELHDRQNNNISLLFFDIDDFKNVNDTFGHNAGDKVLKRVAQIINLHVRKTDLFARWGGEEFIISLINLSLCDAKHIAEKLRNSIEDDSILQEIVGYQITASFGLTNIRENDDVESIIKRVDKCMYQAKKDGKNQIFTF